jgi:hypothetical protein
LTLRNPYPLWLSALSSCLLAASVSVGLPADPSFRRRKCSSCACDVCVGKEDESPGQIVVRGSKGDDLSVLSEIRPETAQLRGDWRMPSSCTRRLAANSMVTPQPKNAWELKIAIDLLEVKLHRVLIACSCGLESDKACSMRLWP